MKKEFCIHGHIIALVGRDAHGACRECRRENFKREYISTPRIKVQFCIRGHDTFICGRTIQRLCKQCKNDFHRNKLAFDINYRLTCSLRTRLWNAINKNSKVGSAVKDLGCSIPEFKQYIESKFYDNMTWDNWGDIWELDHIQELHTFDLTDRKQFLKACHYTNLQPLTIDDHKKKTAKNITKLAALENYNRTFVSSTN